MDREFEKTFEHLCVTRTPRSVWDDFVALSAIAISNELDFRDDREELEASILEKYSSQEIWMMQELFDRTADVLEKNPNQDYLGELFSQFQWSKDERLYAKSLEEQENVKSYEAGVLLDMGRYVHISPVDIRRDYFKERWTSDFLLEYADGRKGIRELVFSSNLKKRAVIERLEFSRRYWKVLNIEDWKAVVIGE